MAARRNRFQKFFRDVTERTPFIKMVLSLVSLWILFSTLLWLAERGTPGTHLASLEQAFYWSVAAFSTAGIADAPVTGMGRLIGGTWIVIGSVLFFGAIIATITGYFTRPMQRPVRNLIDTVENNLEHLDDLSVDELELLRKAADDLIEHTERIKQRSARDD